MTLQIVPVALVAVLVAIMASRHSCHPMKPNTEDVEACSKEAAASSSITEEDLAKVKELGEKMKQEFKSGNRTNMKRKGPGQTHPMEEKIDAESGIKDKAAAKNYAKEFFTCIQGKGLERALASCAPAVEANGGKLVAKDLVKMKPATMKLYKEGNGSVTDEDLEKKMTEVVGEEKAKVAVKVVRTMEQCRKDRMASRAE